MASALAYMFKSNKFSLEKAELFAKIADITYLDTPESLIKFKSLGFSGKVSYFDNDGAQAYGLRYKNIHVLSFRGTEPTKINDLLADAKAWRSKSDSIGKVHSGFKHEVDKIWPEIAKWIEPAVLKGEQIYVTGHSLGAAMATIATSRFPDSTICYNYGSPRVGGPRFVKRFNSTYELHRFVNNNDAVCRVPPALVGIMYKHVGNQHYINTYGNIRNATAWQRLKDRFRGYRQAWKKREFFDSLYDHSMKKYVKRIATGKIAL